MTLPDAQALIGIVLGIAVAQQTLEHLAIDAQGRAVFIFRLLAAIGLIFAMAPILCLGVLIVSGLWQLHRYNGPFNGGADKMMTLVVWCLTVSHIMPAGPASDIFIAYLAVQLTLSYVVSGYVKLRNPAWRSGQALADVFAFSAYPVGQNLRKLATMPKLMRAGSWSVIGIEVLFPLSLFHPTALVCALICVAGFHLANACLFGLNRFFWAWMSAFPALIWFQSSILGIS